MADRNPVIIYGALRSGTTLLKLLFDMHSDIDNPGEFDFLTDCLRRQDDGEWHVDRDYLKVDRIFVDSGIVLRDDLEGLDLVHDMVDQIQSRGDGSIIAINLHRNAWAIDLICPGAKIVHIVRDPRDVARSSIGMGWCGLAYFGVDHWIDTEKAWDQIVSGLAAERWLELRYEDLVRAPEKTLQGVCAFMGQTFEPDMLRFHETSTYQPIDGALAEQWRRKASIAELSEVEVKLGPLLTQKGYERSDAPQITLGLFTRKRLWARNKAATIRQSVENYGLPLYLKLKLRQILGPVAGLDGALHRKWEIDRQRIK